MPLPSINITFQTLGITAISRSQKGIVAVILVDEEATVQGTHQLRSADDIPAKLGLVNKAYLRQAFVGYVTPPKQVLVYVVDGEDKTLADALSYFGTQQFDYLVGAPDLAAEDARAIAAWVKSERENDHMVKAVLPEIAADSEAIVNFATGGIRTEGGTSDAAGYCARIAGLITGTPMTVSCTYAPLPEVTDVERLAKTAMDDAIDAGKFILFHDGEKVKVGRGVNSLTTVTAEKGEQFKKLKIVEALDMIKNDIRLTAQDGYIGKYANSYDNKCLLIMAIKGYFEELERAGILAKETSVVEIDIGAQEEYLRQKQVDVSGMSEQEIKEANTDSHVFLRATISILDAIEDIDLSITI